MVLIDLFIFFVYRYLGLPFALGVLKLFSDFFPAKIQEMISDRSAQNLQSLPARPIWIHAASGEIEYAKSVIRSLKEEFPQTPILVTYFSPSAKKLIQRFPGIDLGMALPWDQPSDLEKFLNFYQPRICLIARTDVWPEMAKALKKRKIPSALFAATFSNQSSRKGFFSSSLNRVALNSLSEIFCVSEDDKSNLLALGIKTPLHVTGDTRFDQVLHRLQMPNPVRTELRPSSETKVFVCGSTWPEDEEILLAAFPHWLAMGGKIILAPHEIATDRMNLLEAQLKAKSWTVSRYTAAKNWDSQVLLIDQIGALQELYSWGHLAFVGGSFKEKVHSVMEPLCVGIPVCVGPHHTNNREALQFQFVVLESGLFAVNVVQNSHDLSLVMEKTWHQKKPHPIISQKVKQASGSTDRLVDWVCATIP